MKRILVLLVAFSMVMTCFACLKPADIRAEEEQTALAESAAAEKRICTRFTIAGESYDAPLFEYELLPDQTARLTGYYHYIGDIDIPESLDGYPVSTIGKDAIPDTDYSGLLRITIPDCVTVIEPNAFSHIHGIIEFSVSETHPTLQVIDNVLLCPAENRIIRGYIRGDYRIPEGIETLDDYAFWGCACKSIDIPASLTKPGRNPFAMMNCTKDTRAALRQVTLSPDNPVLELKDGILFDKEDHRLIWCYDVFDSDHMEYEIEEGIERIDDFAFWRWSMLRAVTIPASVTDIGANPFPWAELQLDSRNEAFILNDGMLISRNDHRLVAAVPGTGENSLVPEGTETIGDYAFYYFTASQSYRIVISDSVGVIRRNAFQGCRCQITIPAGIRKIGAYAFASCEFLSDLPAFRDGIEIGTGAFTQCNGIEKLTVDGGTAIGQGAFAICDNLREIRIGEGASRVVASAFSDCPALEKAEFGEGLSFIGSGVFSRCDSLQAVSLPESLSYISENALMNQMIREYNEEYMVMITRMASTVHAIVSAGSTAELYCKEYGIEYTAR